METNYYVSCGNAGYVILKDDRTFLTNDPSKATRLTRNEATNLAKRMIINVAIAFADVKQDMIPQTIESFYRK